MKRILGTFVQSECLTFFDFLSSNSYKACMNVCSDSLYGTAGLYVPMYVRARPLTGLVRFSVCSYFWTFSVVSIYSVYLVYFLKQPLFHTVFIRLFWVLTCFLFFQSLPFSFYFWVFSVILRDILFSLYFFKIQYTCAALREGGVQL